MPSHFVPGINRGDPLIMLGGRAAGDGSMHLSILGLPPGDPPGDPPRGPLGGPPGAPLGSPNLGLKCSMIP